MLPARNDHPQHEHGKCSRSIRAIADRRYLRVRRIKRWNRKISDLPKETGRRKTPPHERRDEATWRLLRPPVSGNDAPGDLNPATTFPGGFSRAKRKMVLQCGGQLPQPCREVPRPSVAPISLDFSAPSTRSAHFRQIQRQFCGFLSKRASKAQGHRSGHDSAAPSPVSA